MKKIWAQVSLLHKEVILWQFNEKSLWDNVAITVNHTLCFNIDCIRGNCLPLWWILKESNKQVSQAWGGGGKGKEENENYVCMLIFFVIFLMSVLSIFHFWKEHIFFFKKTFSISSMIGFLLNGKNYFVVKWKEKVKVNLKYKE